MKNSLLIPTLTITTLGVLILGGVMMEDKQQIEEQKTTFTTQQVVPTITITGSTETITTIDPNTCMTTEIPVCKKRFWKDFDEKTCKQVTFEVDCMFYNEVSTNQQEYSKLLSEYGLAGREQGEIACSTTLETININGNACTEEEIGNTKPDTNTKGMCRDNSRTCRKVIRDGKEVLLREKNLGARYDPTGKTEICDGRDNDCDGQIDEGYQQKEYLRDFDGDSRGNIDMKTKACFPPPGHVLKAGDCDDLDKAVYPGAYEVCDLKDNNCNRQIDEYLVDCNEEVKECTVMLPLGRNGGLGGSNNKDINEGNISKESDEAILDSLIEKHKKHKDKIEDMRTMLTLKNYEALYNKYLKKKDEETYTRHDDVINTFIIQHGQDIELFTFYKNCFAFFEFEALLLKIGEIIAIKNPAAVIMHRSLFNEQDSRILIEKSSKTIINNNNITLFFNFYGLIAQHIPDAYTKLIEYVAKYGKKAIDYIDNILPSLTEEQKKIFFQNITNEMNVGDHLYNLSQLPNNPEFNEIKELFHSLLQIKGILIAKKLITLDSSLHTIQEQYNESLVIGSINIYVGLLKTYINNKKDYISNSGSINREGVKEKYEANLAKFIAAGKNFSSTEILSTFIVRPDQEGGDDDNGAFTDANKKLIKLYQCLGEKGTCTSIRSNEQTMTPDEIIALFAKQIHDDPDGYHLFHLGGHGGEDGSLHLAGGDRTKEHFDKLFNLQVAYPGRIRIDITSCNSFWKDDNRKDNTLGNISLDSSQQTAKSLAEIILLEALEQKDGKINSEADYDEDGVVNYHEALIYRAINYNLSLTPIMFDDNGKVVDIVGADIFPQDIQDRSDRENNPFVDTQCSMDC